MTFECGRELDFGEAEPYDASELCLNADGRPESIWSAICLMIETEPDVWAEMAREIFGVEPEVLGPTTVMEMTQATNECDRLGSPCRVWIDAQHRYSVRVW